MRKATLCLLILWATIGVAQQWQTLPQSFVLFGQTAPIAQTTLLTPTQPGIYRLVIYFSTVGGSAVPQGMLSLVVLGQDIGSPAAGIYRISEACAIGNYNSLTPTISLKPGVPLTYQVDVQNLPVGCSYNLAVTVEQLT